MFEEAKSDIKEELASLGERMDYSFRPDFKYRSNNPYNDKLKSFSSFVMRDNESEQYRGSWNKNVFKNDNQISVEIGVGYGNFMTEYCTQNPSINFVGIDYRFKRSFALCKTLSELQYQNFRYLRAQGERLKFIFGEDEVDNIFYFFPDPWPKKKHHKKRLFRTPFLETAAQILKKSGKVFIKTDHDEYFAWMLEIFKDFNEKNKIFKINLKTTDLRREHPDHFLSKYKTKFEHIFIKQNINIKALELEKL